MCRKLKKLLQRKKSELDSKQQEELNRSLQAHEKDHILCPFIGINPEYMEMSESNPGGLSLAAACLLCFAPSMRLF